MKKHIVNIVAASAFAAAALTGAAQAADAVKIGFLVKQPDEPWFQAEWKFAEQAGKEHGFEVVKIAVPDGEKTLTAIDTLAASGAKGFVICTPDVRLGPAIVNRAKQHGLKILAVDDRFVGADGKFMEDVPYLGLNAYAIGQQQGELLVKLMKERGWKAEETGMVVSTQNEVDTQRQRTTGAMDAVKAAGFPAGSIYEAPVRISDIPNAFDAVNAVLVRHPEKKHWLVGGMNDNVVLGGIRATEGVGFKPENVIGIGINGTDAIAELSRKEVSGFYGSLLLSPDVHGGKTATMMYEWVTKGVQPPMITPIKDATLITRENFKAKLTALGLM